MNIWKYELFETDEQRVKMPEGAKILTVQVQNGKPFLWALVRPQNKPEERIFQTYGTGNPFEDGKRNYIGTYQLQGGLLVFHVFEYTGI